MGTKNGQRTEWGTGGIREGGGKWGEEWGDRHPSPITKIGDPVDLVISLGEHRVAVPDIAGMTQTDAGAALVAAGFVVGNHREIWGEIWGQSNYVLTT